MKGACNSGILRSAALLLAIAGSCTARAGAVFEHVSVSLTLIDACTVSGVDREVATDASRGRASGPVHVACTGGAAPSVTFARVSRAMAFAAGVAPPAGEGVFHAIREDLGDDAIVRATVTF